MRFYWSDNYRTHRFDKHSAIILLKYKISHYICLQDKTRTYDGTESSCLYHSCFADDGRFTTLMFVPSSVSPSEFMVVRDSYSCVVQNQVFAHFSYKCFVLYCIVLYFKIFSAI
jgi:hypothetical protein